MAHHDRNPEGPAMTATPRPSAPLMNGGRLPLDSIRTVGKPERINSFSEAEAGAEAGWGVPVNLYAPTEIATGRAFVGPFIDDRDAATWIARWFPSADIVASAEPLPLCGRPVVLREVEGCAAEIIVCTRIAGSCPWARSDGAFVGLGRVESPCAAPGGS